MYTRRAPGSHVRGGAMAKSGDSEQDGRMSLLSRVMLVRRGELPGLIGGFLYFFFLLCSYYILRPVRDEMGVR
ncbi:MAG: hypothetical protein ACOC5B_01675, partial [Myxococcota bacterium]